MLRSPPATLAGLPLDHRLSGEAALEAIRRLHDGDEIELASAWIAHYGRDVSAMLYVGIGGDRREAARTVARMRGRIADGGTPFVGIHEARLFGADVYVMTGGGQLHFLYPDGKQVIWLSADPAVACAALAEALGAEEGADGCGPAPP